MAGNSSPITVLLSALGKRDENAAGELLPLVYEELRLLAQRQMIGQRANHTLNPTALVHEAYLKLVHSNQTSWQDRAHFLAVASMAMRQILINYAHQRNAQKRGGNQVMATFDESFMGGSDSKAEEIIALDEALDRLKAINERQSQVVTCRFFGGLKHEEIAEVLGVSEPTVRRDWRIAKAWLIRELSHD